jgi:hypothetical protein
MQINVESCRGRHRVRAYLVSALTAGAIVGIAASIGTRGLLSPPAESPASLKSVPPEHPFVRDPSGGFSRIVFETDEDPNFRLVIREFSFPPDRQSHTITLPSGAFLDVLGGQGEISIAGQRTVLALGARTAVSAGVPIEVANNGEQPVNIRALIVEAK